MSKKCDFCGTKNLEVIKYKCFGVDAGKKVRATVSICVCCDAQTDKEWMAERLGWGEVTKMEVKNK